MTEVIPPTLRPCEYTAPMDVVLNLEIFGAANDDIGRFSASLDLAYASFVDPLSDRVKPNGLGNSDDVPVYFLRLSLMHLKMVGGNWGSR
jgi:hypothetical protein